MNVTYFTGAGASANALPVWSQQASAMLLGTSMLHKDHKLSANDIMNSAPNKNPFSTGTRDYLLWDMAWFGYRAMEFGSVDTFAKKLFLNKNFQLLNRLKLAVSVNFSLLEFTRDADTKYPALVDQRYISLFAKILEATQNGDVYIKPEYSFITWNYDLQLERAFRKFMPNEKHEIGELALNHLSKGPDLGNRSSKKQVIHLNGYHGAYATKDKLNFYVEREWNESTSFDAFFEKMSFVTKSHEEGNINFNSTIRYAWENHESSNLEDAIKIMRTTQVLVIIGYSFPAFNRSIDKLLFQQMHRLQKIIVQDPSFNSDFLLEVLGPGMAKHIITLPKEQFWTN